MAAKHFLDLRQATPAAWGYLHKKKYSPFGSRELSTGPAMEKPAPLLAA